MSETFTEIAEGLFAIHIALWHAPSQSLIFSDLHIGYEAELHAKGVLVPNFQTSDVIERIKYILHLLKRQKLCPVNIVLNGDLKHSFGKISSQEWTGIERIIRFLQQHCKNVIIVKGNHDVLLSHIAERFNLKTVPSFKIGGLLALHGDKLPTKEELDGVTIIVTGHDHPAIQLSDGAKREKYKCFLVGKYLRKILVVQPSTQPLVQGTDVLLGTYLSPLLPSNVGKFRVFVVDDVTCRVLDFGPVRIIVENCKSF